MSIITIDGVAYATDSLSNAAKEELAGMQACDQKIATMQTEFAIAQTARNAFANALKSLLPKAKPKVNAKKA